MRSTLTMNSSLARRFSPGRILAAGTQMPRQLVIGIILVLALFAFELFNFDTTRYALQSLLGEVRFAGLMWATILAVAFCAIDFAGLARLFTPERGREEPKEIWYLTGAWLLGATMNAVMTWWAVSLTLLNHDLGNEVLSREQLLTFVPVFVAVLVWLTRILFIGSVTIAGERLLDFDAEVAHRPVGQPHSSAERQRPSAERQVPKRTSPPQPYKRQETQAAAESVNLARPPRQTAQQSTRVRQRPPRPTETSWRTRNAAANGNRR